MPLLVFDWQVMNLEYLIQICGAYLYSLGTGREMDVGNPTCRQIVLQGSHTSWKIVESPGFFP